MYLYSTPSITATMIVNPIIREMYPCHQVLQFSKRNFTQSFYRQPDAGLIKNKLSQIGPDRRDGASLGYNFTYSIIIYIHLYIYRDVESLLLFSVIACVRTQKIFDVGFGNKIYVIIFRT